MKYILITFLTLLIAYFLLCNKIHINKEITPNTQPKVTQTKPKEYKTEITTQKQKSDTKIKVKTKKIITKTINIKDTTVTKINDSTYSLRIDQIDSFLFDLKDNNIKVIVQDTNTKIIDLTVSKKENKIKNYNKIVFISGILTTILVIFLVK